MTTSPSELALQLLIDFAMAIVLGVYIRRSIKSGYAVGLWWDFQRQSEPVRFWTWLTVVGLVGMSSFGTAFEMAARLTDPS